MYAILDIDEDDLETTETWITYDSAPDAPMNDSDRPTDPDPHTWRSMQIDGRINEIALSVAQLNALISRAEKERRSLKVEEAQLEAERDRIENERL